MAQEMITKPDDILALQKKLELVKASERIQKQLEDIDIDNEDIFRKEINHVGYETEPFGTVVADIPKHEGHSSITTSDYGLRWSHNDIPFETVSVSITWENPTPIMEGDAFPGPSLDFRYLTHHVTAVAQQKQMKPITLTKYDLETVLDLNHELKKTLEKQNKKFVEFKDKTDHWETTILQAFNTKTQSSKQLQALNHSERCVMGSTFNWTSDWYHHSNCGDCNWLGMDGLATFTNFQQHNYGEKTEPIRVTSRDGFEHYKALWEYHMNSEHYHNGSVSQDVLK